MTVKPNSHIQEIGRRLHSLATACTDAQGEEFETFLAVQGVDEFLWESGGCDLPRPDKQKILQATAHRMLMNSELGRVLELLRRAGVRVLAMKGPVLSALSYGSPFKRSYGDLDLLISPDQVLLACQALRQGGYERTSPSFSTRGRRFAARKFLKAFTLSGGAPLCRIDLHLHLLSQWVAFEVPFSELWRERQSLDLSPVVSVETLSNEHQIIFLAFHGAQDGWSKLKQLMDLAVTLSAVTLDSQRLYRIVGARRPLLDRAISLTVDLLGAHPPAGHRPFFPSPSEAESFFLRAMKASEEPQLQLLVPSLWEKVSPQVLWRCLQAILVPSVEDIQQLELPPFLYRGYHAVRFVRLVKKVLLRRKLK